MAGYGNPGIARTPDYRSRRASRAADRSLPRQRSRFFSSSDADTGRNPRGWGEDAGNRAGATRARCRRSARPLAQLVHEKTGGNPFFTIQFLSELAEEGLLTFQHGEGRWSWNLERI